MRTRAGFTLIELTVVLFIIAVAAAVTVSALLEDPVDDDIVAAGRQLETLFRVARDSAQRSGSAVNVSIDSLTGMVWVGSVSDTLSTDVASMTPGFTLALPPTVQLQLSKPRAHFEFAPTGAVFGDTIVLRTALLTRTITIDPWTGDAIVH
ncbi:pilus assembly FimT family protein [Piscinibacter sp.]|uniref:pilus assembly FimT family protein n=1 Tax=Piscinibacter sp. TaxID=1903157 RepID=UPI002C12DC44|nr:prepilin-type N-terminal cleavage/methylation domain-containing protein [Albitalea sp.]HUG26108.1 prepilin-type N-terminal cleavage/methylation domain-containing protein [Albitalea sp.]